MTLSVLSLACIFVGTFSTWSQLKSYGCEAVSSSVAYILEAFCLSIAFYSFLLYRTTKMETTANYVVYLLFHYQFYLIHKATTIFSKLLKLLKNYLNIFLYVQSSERNWTYIAVSVRLSSSWID